MKKLIVGMAILTTAFCGGKAFASEPPVKCDSNLSQVRMAEETADVAGGTTDGSDFEESQENENSASGDEAINSAENLKDALEKRGFEVEAFAEYADFFKLVRYTGTEENVQVPIWIIEIGDEAFKNCTKIKSVQLPECLAIGNCAFKNCTNIKSVQMPKCIKIGNYAFTGCTSLEKINIPNDVQRIGKYAFINCKSLNSINIPGSVTDIIRGTFLGCESLSEVTLNDGLMRIHDHAFAGCSSLKSIDLPMSLMGIYDGAFNGCKRLECVKFNGDFKRGEGDNADHGYIGNLAFYNCDSLKKVNFSEKIRYENNSFPNGCIVNGKEIRWSIENIDSLREEARKIREKMLALLKKIEDDGIDWTEYRTARGRFGESEDGIAKLLNKYDGYAASPKVVDDEDFDRLSEGKIVLYRGLGDKHGRTGAEFADEFRYGRFFNGVGNYGNGTYATTELKTAWGYAYDHGSSTQRDENIGLLKMMLEDLANIIDYDVLKDIAAFYKNDDIQYLIWLYLNEDKPWTYLVDYDIGNLAEIAGYDAIRCPEGEYVILNRGKVIVSNRDATV